MIVPLYGPDYDHLSYNKDTGSLKAEIAVPDGSWVRKCEHYGNLELFTPTLGHIGEEALLSFAEDDDDPNFKFVFTRSA